MEVFVARHPIFDQQKEVYGYELAFRSDFEEYYTALESGKETVDFMAFVNFNELADGKRGIVNFSRSLLLKNFPFLLPKESLTVGISADLEPDPEVLEKLNELKDAGYTLALKGCKPERPPGPLLDFVNIVRFDSKELNGQSVKICQVLRQRGIMPLAEGVESSGEFDQAVQKGYSLFKGDFFSKPVENPDKEITANKLTYMKLLKEVNSPEMDYGKISSLIQQDVSMTFRLLKFMNSAWFGLRYEVNSIRHALVLLGPKEIRRWISMVVITNTGDDKPHELLLRSLTRAKVAEQIGPMANMGNMAPELFLMGMFSVIDALTDRPMEGILQEVPLNENISAALLGGSNQFRLVLDMILNYEKGDWELFGQHAKSLAVDEKQIPQLFRSSLKWANGALAEM
ncbi:MAG: EAL and HDOD domain-containing protein [Phycisphaerae bacterium]